MTDKIFYFIIPQPEESLEKKMQEIFGQYLDTEDDKLIFFGNGKKSGDIFYTFWDSHKVEMIVKELKLLEIVFMYKDITVDVLMGAQDNQSEFVRTFTKEEAKMQLSIFLKKNQTKDNILDKIRIKGIESLTELEMEILENT